MSRFSYKDDNFYLKERKIRSEATSLSELLVKMNNFYVEYDKKAKLKSIHPTEISMGVVRTSHSHPIGQKSTGWGPYGTEEGKHILEIGWNGRVQIVWNGTKGPDGFCSEMVRGTCISTGSGGYNGGSSDYEYRCNYELSLYIKDFPLIYEKYLSFINDKMVIEIREMINSKNQSDRNLAEGIVLESEEIYNKIIKIYQILKYNPDKNDKYQEIYSLNLLIKLILPYENFNKQREIWEENKNLFWKSSDKRDNY